MRPQSQPESPHRQLVRQAQPQRAPARRELALQGLVRPEQELRERQGSVPALRKRERTAGGSERQRGVGVAQTEGA